LDRCPVSLALSVFKGTQARQGACLVCRLIPLDLVCDKISTNAVKKLSTPANASEAPSVAKVWQQVKDNAPTFATVWGLVFATGFLVLMATLCLQLLAHLVFDTYPSDVFAAADVFAAVGSLSTIILADMVYILMVAVPAIYYATDHCPGPGETLRILLARPLRYLLAGFLFAVAGAVGSLLCIIPGILVALTTPFYVYYVFTTDLDLINCLSKAFKGDKLLEQGIQRDVAGFRLLSCCLVAV